MITLSRNAAIAAVRKNLDEQGLNESAMFGESTDNVSLDDMIAKTIPEAINAVNLEAPAYLLYGSSFAPSNVSIADGVLSFTISANTLRLVAFQTSDSPIVVTDVIPESSAEGRKQLNKYIRGTFDAPVLVQEQGVGNPLRFRYYTVKPGTPSGGVVKRCEFVPFEEYNPDKTVYAISKDLYWAIICRLTAMVLSIYGETGKASYFSELSKSYQQ